MSKFYDLFIPDQRIEEHGVILRRFPDGLETNVPHLVTHHSPSGFEWGYGGSGCADLALNLCELALMRLGHKGRQTKCYEGSCFELAYEIHQDFKWQVISLCPRAGGDLPFNWLLDKVISLCTKRAGKCYICGSGALERIFESRAREIWECKKCGNQFPLEDI